LHISEKVEGKWAVLPKRWVVERTFSWLGNFRRLSKDFEILTGTAENMIRIAMMKITLEKCVCLMFYQTASILDSSLQHQTAGSIYFQTPVDCVYYLLLL
jgi:hypothetical protein